MDFAASDMESYVYLPPGIYPRQQLGVHQTPPNLSWEGSGGVQEAWSGSSLQMQRGGSLGGSPGGSQGGSLRGSPRGSQGGSRKGSQGGVSSEPPIRGAPPPPLQFTPQDVDGDPCMTPPHPSNTPLTPGGYPYPYPHATPYPYSTPYSYGTPYPLTRPHSSSPRRPPANPPLQARSQSGSPTLAPFSQHPSLDNPNLLEDPSEGGSGVWDNPPALSVPCPGSSLSLHQMLSHTPPGQGAPAGNPLVGAPLEEGSELASSLHRSGSDEVCTMGVNVGLEVKQ